MYAIIESCGKQYKVSEGDVVFFEKLDVEEGKSVTFDKVIFLLYFLQLQLKLQVQLKFSLQYYFFSYF